MAPPGTVLVTGHQGYIGSHVAAVAARRGWEVVGLDVGLYRTPGSTSGREDGVARELRKDVRDVVPADLEGVSAIVHLAGLSSDPLAELVPEATRAINHHAALRLATLAREAGVRRFLFASTLGVYGDTGEDWCDEETPLAPTTVYRESKADTERALRALRDERFTPLSLRLPTLYGHSRFLRRDLVVNVFVLRAEQGLPLRVDGGGVQWRPLLHVRDAARAFVALLSIPPEQAPEGAVNVCAEELNLSIADLARLVAAAYPSLELRWPPGPPPATGSYRARSTRLRRWLPDYRFAYTLERGIRELGERLRTNPLSEAEMAVGVRAAFVEGELAAGRLSRELRRVPAPPPRGGSR